MIDELLKRYPILTDQIRPNELRVILRELEAALNRGISGDIVELGCYEGTTAVFVRRLLDKLDSSKRVYLYDSFSGLPSKTTHDQSPAGMQFKAGELHASKDRLIQNFKKSGLKLPIIKKAWFSELVPTDLPDQISFAFLDGDFYNSILDSLKLVWPKLAEGATVIVDDYQNEALPGAYAAVQQWLRDHPAQIRAEASLAIIYPSS